MPVSKLVVIFLCGLAMVGLLAIGSSLIQQLGCEGQMVNINFNPPPHQEIWGDRFMGQSFTTSRDGLNRVDLMLLTYRRKNTAEITFRLLELLPGVLDPNQAVERFSTTFNAEAVQDQSWHQFHFPAIPDSAGKTYLVTLHSPASEPGNAITTGGIDRNIYSLGSAFFGPAPVVGDLTFRACFELNGAQKLQLLAHQLTRNRPGMWGNSAFYLGGMIVYLGLLLGFFGMLVRWAWGKP